MAHSWVAGMMVVSDEDLALIAATRRSRGEDVECQWCSYIPCGESDATGETVCLGRIGHSGPHVDELEEFPCNEVDQMTEMQFHAG